MPPRIYRTHTLLLAILACTSPLSLAVEGEIYRSTDAEGRVIFSDQASESAKPVKIPPTNTMTEVEVPALKPVAPLEPGAGDAIANAYSRLEIITPTNGATVIAPNGILSMSVALVPALRDGHRLQLLLDGTPRASSRCQRCRAARMYWKYRSSMAKGSRSRAPAPSRCRWCDLEKVVPDPAALARDEAEVGNRIAMHLFGAYNPSRLLSRRAMAPAWLASALVARFLLNSPEPQPAASLTCPWRHYIPGFSTT